MDTLDSQIEAFERMRRELECDHRGEWALIHDCRLVGTYPTLDDAADYAMNVFSADDIFLLRQIGRPEVSQVPSVFRVS